ncbi:hypothetical protein [Fredinandcohnia quinoae]|uniref:Uncharacterized protein n=1 Tax=Fredinandcohnia quinoae TaxID=2918902 RepID=A0AAW5E2V2_9BACI|nr:hypothetical protein [Fredinandcohnia sp. SECRCQ15]MCH1624417.1 hypothetical protein [Fredinandcohnia sp. SECRCQ15]
MIRKWKMYLILVLPWLTVKKLGKNSLLRFLPTIVFSDLVIALISELSQKLKWWKVKNPLFPKLATDVSFVFGPFTIINLWIFKLTFKRFWLYLLTNIFADYLFAYPLTTFAEKLRIYKMGRMSRKQLFLLSLAVAVLNYLYQSLFVEPLRRNQTTDDNKEP